MPEYLTNQPVIHINWDIFSNDVWESITVTTQKKKDVMDRYLVQLLCENIIYNRSFGYNKSLFSSLFLSVDNVPQWIKKILTESPRTKLINHIDNLEKDIPLIKEFLKECPRCLRRKFSNCLYETDTENNILCDDCVTILGLHRWSDNVYRSHPEPRIFGYQENDREKLFTNLNFDKDEDLLGLEIELYIPGETSEVVSIANEAIKLGNCFAERDGSLSRSNGVEFVFAPFRFQQMSDYKNLDLFKITDFLLRKKVRGWDACEDGNYYGMHISVNARTMSRLHVGKFCSFINSNRSFFERVSGRLENRFAEYYSSEPQHYRNLSSRYLASAYRSFDRIEVRIFRSALNWQRIARNCQLVDSVRTFTKNCSVKNLTIKDYRQFLEQPINRKVYGELREFLGTRKVKNSTGKYATVNVNEADCFQKEVLYEKVV